MITIILAMKERRQTKQLPYQQYSIRLLKTQKKNYCLLEYVTINEMLIPFRGRCGFRMYMTRKPYKYGIKVMCLADSKTSYLYEAYIYTGQNSDGIGLSQEERKWSKPTQSVIRLTKDIQKTNRNITADNWFSSIKVAEELHKRGLTYVGTLRKDKKNSFPIRITVMSACFGFKDNYTLLLLPPPPQNSAVVLLYMMHTIKQSMKTKASLKLLAFTIRPKQELIS